VQPKRILIGELKGKKLNIAKKNGQKQQKMLKSATQPINQQRQQAAGKNAK
jgi:hypothetical protein